jgi:hypothetical protein
MWTVYKRYDWDDYEPDKNVPNQLPQDKPTSTLRFGLEPILSLRLIVACEHAEKDIPLWRDCPVRPRRARTGVEIPIHRMTPLTNP